MSLVVPWHEPRRPILHKARPAFKVTVLQVAACHFEAALQEVLPRIPKDLLELYARFGQRGQ